MRIKQCGIIGLGLIGGSLAKALRNCGCCERVIAFNRNPEAAAKALNDGVIDAVAADMAEFRDCGVIFLCAPVEACRRYIDALARIVSPECVITDVCSTKTEITDFAARYPGLRFIGGHPMAGTEHSGYDSSFAHLFENAYYILTDPQNCGESDIALLTGIIERIGAIPIRLTAAAHDRVTAGISHLPHVAAFALTGAVARSDADGYMRLLAAGGFKDITRIADSPPELWRGIIFSNKEAVLDMLERYIHNLESMRQMIAAGDSAGLESAFAAAREYRRGIDGAVNGAIPRLFDIYVDTEDRPGIIGEIATLLGANGINIKNIQVLNSRENIGGALRLSLAGASGAERASELLAERGFRVN